MLCGWPAFMCYVQHLLPCMPTPHAIVTPHIWAAGIVHCVSTNWLKTNWILNYSRNRPSGYTLMVAYSQFHAISSLVCLKEKGGTETRKSDFVPFEGQSQCPDETFTFTGDRGTSLIQVVIGLLLAARFFIRFKTLNRDWKRTFDGAPRSIPDRATRHQHHHGDGSANTISSL